MKTVWRDIEDAIAIVSGIPAGEQPNELITVAVSAANAIAERVRHAKPWDDIRIPPFTRTSVGGLLVLPEKVDILWMLRSVNSDGSDGEVIFNRDQSLQAIHGDAGANGGESFTYEGRDEQARMILRMTSSVDAEFKVYGTEVFESYTVENSKIRSFVPTSARQAFIAFLESKINKYMNGGSSSDGAGLLQQAADMEMGQQSREVALLPLESIFHDDGSLYDGGY